MASKRGPESFMKRQRERAKQLEQMQKDARRRDRSARKKAEKNGVTESPLAKLSGGPLGIVMPPRITPLGPPRITPLGPPKITPLGPAKITPLGPKS
jgi:hypothetical protein